MKRLTILCLCVLAARFALAQDGVLPADIPAQKFAQLPAMFSPELSPDGSHLAYFAPHNGRSHLIIQSLAAEPANPVVVPPVGDLDFDWLHWANDDRLVFTVSATRSRYARNTVETRLWAIDENGANPLHIVRPSRTSKTGSSLKRDLPDAQIQDNVIHWLPDEPHHILLSLDGDQNGNYEVRRIDVRDGSYKLVREDTRGIQSWLTDQNGDVRLGWGLDDTRRRIMTKTAEGRWVQAEKAPWWDDSLFPQAFSESADVLFVRGRNATGHAAVWKKNIASGEIVETVFERDNIDAGRVVPDPITRLPVGVEYVDHYRRTEYFDKSLAALQRGLDKALPNSVNEIVSLTRDRQKVLIHSYSDTDPGTYSFLERDSGSLSFFAEAMPGLNPALMSSVEAIHYNARDGLEIPAYLTLPKGAARENLPVVVMPHGGPASRDDKSFWYLSQFIAARGYAVFQPNFRGSSGYGRGFERAGRNEWGGKMQEDVTDGTQWLIEQGIADAERICIVGWSYGGYSAAMGAVQTPDLYQCAASINGVLDLPRLIVQDRSYIGGSVWTQHMGLEDEKSKVVSPYHQAERIKVPVLIIQAEDDARVPHEHGKRMANRLRRLDKTYEFVEVELGGHSMTNEAARVAILTSVEEFLAENL